MDRAKAGEGVTRPQLDALDDDGLELEVSDQAGVDGESTRIGSGKTETMR